MQKNNMQQYLLMQNVSLWSLKLDLCDKNNLQIN